MSDKKEIRVEFDFKPRPYQLEAHQKRKRFSVYVWHRRAGKSYFSFMELILEASRTPKGKFAYMAPLRKQAKSIAWDTMKDLLGKLAEFCKFNEQELEISLPNGAKIFITGADNPDALRGGGFNGVVLDEVSQMKKELWKQVIRPALADRKGWAILIGTVKGVNTFSSVYFKALRNPRWHTDVRKVSETNALDADEIESIREELEDDPSGWAREMECDFSAGVANTLLSVSDTQNAQARTIGEAEFTYQPKILGVDVARYGDDRSVILRRQGRMVFPAQVFSKMDTMSLADRVASNINEFSPDVVFVDNGGIGGGVIDRLRQLGYPVVAVDFGGTPLDARYENKRSEMWWDMAAFVKSGACLPPGSDLLTDLTGPTFNYKNKRGKLSLESKDSMKSRGLKSPDVGDALALTFAAPVAITTPNERLSRQFTSGVVSGGDYDPFSEVR